MKKNRSGAGASDRSGDRFLHNFVSAHLAGAENMKRDQPIDAGAREFGSSHRRQFPHRSIPEACAYLCWRDFIDGRKIDVATNAKITTGHFIVDALPAKMKERMKLIQTIAGALL